MIWKSFDRIASNDPGMHIMSTPSTPEPSSDGSRSVVDVVSSVVDEIVATLRSLLGGGSP